MDDSRHALGPLLRALTLTLAGSLLLSCSGPDASDNGTTPEPADRAATKSARSLGQKTGPTGTRVPEAAAGQGVDALPSSPATHSEVTLARQLGTAAAVLRDPDATRADLRQAGEFQQLAVRTLASQPPAFRRQVTSRLRAPAAALTRNAVQATRALHAMTTPEHSLPSDWRIVEPPPPGELLGHYRHAQRRTGVHWTYLAAINLVETRMGRIRGVSSAGAQGPMQFLPSTWDLYGAGGDIDDHRDAVLAAARLLKANGAPGDMSGALWHYNASDSYVRAVTEHARAMQRSTSAYRGYWHWRVLYSHVRGTYVLPVGYPAKRPQLLRHR